MIRNNRTRMNLMLDIGNNPIIDSYWFWADPIVVSQKAENSEFWLYNNFINLRIYNETPLQSLYFFNGNYYNKMVEISDCPFLSTQLLNFDKEDKKILGRTIIEILEYALEASYCLIVMVNRKYIPAYGMDKDNFHQIMIYGYDKKTEKIYFCDNDAQGKYRKGLCCDRGCFEQAYEGYRYFDIQEPVMSRGVFLLKPCGNKKYTIQWEYIKKQLAEYLNSSNYLNSVWWSYGINVYDELMKSIDMLTGNEGSKMDDIKSLCVLYDHKKVMNKRIEMLCKTYDISKFYMLQYHDIVEKSKLIIRLFMRYTVNCKTDILDKMIQLLEEVKVKEIAILSEIIKKL